MFGWLAGWLASVCSHLPQPLAMICICVLILLSYKILTNSAYSFSPSFHFCLHQLNLLYPRALSTTRCKLRRAIVPSPPNLGASSTLFLNPQMATSYWVPRIAYSSVFIRTPSRPPPDGSAPCTHCRSARFSPTRNLGHQRPYSSTKTPRRLRAY